MDAPKEIKGFSPTELQVIWPDGTYVIPYFEIRFSCPCAGCVDENTGVRTLDRTSVSPTVRPVSAQTVGQYAVQFIWNDGHQTGIFHFDRLRELTSKFGRKLTS